MEQCEHTSKKQKQTTHRTGAQRSASFEQARARTATMTSLPPAPPERCVSVRMLEATFLAKQPAMVCGRPGCRVCAIREHSGRRPTRHSVLVTYTVLLEHDVQPKACKSKCAQIRNWHPRRVCRLCGCVRRRLVKWNTQRKHEGSLP